MKSLTEKEYEEIRKELDNCQNPLYFFHDDPDGLCSFLQFYKYKNEGKGVIVKSTPIIDSKFLRKVKEYQPDKIFVLDIADVSQDFIDQVKVPIIWLDHHGPYERTNIKYFNPRLHEKKRNPPVAYMSKFVTQDEDYEWMSVIGTISDWFLPSRKEIKAINQKYPDLLPADIKTPEEALFNTLSGTLSKVLSFILKGGHNESMKYVKVMSRIKSYKEIMEQETPQGKYIFKKYDKINKEYEKLLKTARKKATKSRFLIFEYSEDTMSFTGDIANELLYLYPKKIIIIARNKSGEMKCSMRASEYNLPILLEKSLQGIGGRGGGHEHAAGVVVPIDDWEQFIKNMKKEVKELNTSNK